MKRLNAALAAVLIMLSISGCAAPSDTSGAAATSATSEVTEQPSAGESAGSTTLSETESEPPLSYSGLLQCRYYDKSSFHLYDSRSEDYPYSGEILSGVVPHHLTAGHMISGFFKAAAESRTDIETVVIIAPLHYESDDLLITSHRGWATPYGAIDCDTEASGMFADDLGAALDDEMLQHDHSASSHVPFVKYYLPEADVACLLVSPKAAGDTPQKIADTLTELSRQKECLFLFSIDFSHYLTPEEADENDEETLSAVLSADTAAIEKMSNDNVDSPYCLSAYIRLSQALGGEVTAADNSNTFDLLSYPYNSNHFPEGVTSYFVYITAK